MVCLFGAAPTSFCDIQATLHMFCITLVNIGCEHRLNLSHIITSDLFSHFPRVPRRVFLCSSRSSHVTV